MYYVLKRAVHDESSFVRAQLVNASEFRDAKFSLGKPVAANFPHAIIEVDSVPTDYFTVGPMQVVSSEIVKALKELGANVQLFPAIVMRGEMAVGPVFFVCNVIENVDCLDYDRARYTLDDGVIDKIEELAIDESKLEGIPIARMANAYDTIILVSDHARQVFVSAGVTGMAFVDPSAWRW